MTKRYFDFTIWHKLGIYFGLFLIVIGVLMSIPDRVHHMLETEKRAKEQGSPVWLEYNNLKKRKAYFDECRGMPPLDGDIENATCLSEAASLFPDRNWKQVAEENMKKGL